MFSKFICVLLMCLVEMQQEPVTAVEVKNLMPMLDSTGHFMRYDTNVVRLYYQGELTACRVPVHVQKGEDVTFIQYEYFIWHRDSAFGFELGRDSNADRRINKQYYLDNGTWLTHIYGYHAFQDNVMRMVSSDTDHVAGVLKEKFTGYAKKDTAGKGTVYYTYSKGMMNIPFSLSRELDSIKQMKLTRITVVHHPVYMKEYNMTIQEFSGHYMLDRITVPAGDEVRKYFERYRRLAGKR